MPSKKIYNVDLVQRIDTGTSCTKTGKYQADARRMRNGKASLKKAYEIASVLGLIHKMAVNDELKAHHLPLKMQLAG